MKKYRISDVVLASMDERRKLVYEIQRWIVGSMDSHVVYPGESQIKDDLSVIIWLLTELEEMTGYQLFDYTYEEAHEIYKLGAKMGWETLAQKMLEEIHSQTL